MLIHTNRNYYPYKNIRMRYFSNHVFKNKFSRSVFKIQVVQACLRNLGALLSFLSFKDTWSKKLSHKTFAKTYSTHFYPVLLLSSPRIQHSLLKALESPPNTARIKALKECWEHHGLRNQQFNHLSLVKLILLGHRFPQKVFPHKY